MAQNLQKILPFEESGNFDSDNLVIFLHGYPDTTAMWHGISNKVQNDAFMLNFSYPNYSEKSTSLFGLTQIEVVHRVKQIVDVYQKIKKREITVVAHDWGAILAYMFDKEYPGFVKQMITLDVAAWIDRNPKVMKALMSYQLKLIFAFIIGFFLPFIGNWITKSVVNGYFLYKPAHNDRITSKWNYFYFYYFYNMIVSKFKPQVNYLYQYKPVTPIVFVYGEKKPFPFHSPKWVEHLNSTQGSEVLGADCDHWIPQKKEDFVVSIIKRRLNQKK